MFNRLSISLIDFPSLCLRISLGPFLFGHIMNDGSLRVPNEETPLLNTNLRKQHSPTPLPKLQIAIVLIVQVCEPITGMSIYPYINQVSSCLVNRSGSIFRSLAFAGATRIPESLIGFFHIRNLYSSLPRLLLCFNGVEFLTMSVESQLFSSIYLEQRCPCSLLVSLVLFGL